MQLTAPTSLPTTLTLQVKADSGDNEWSDGQALETEFDLTLYSFCCGPIDRVYIMNGDVISFDVNNLVLSPIANGIDFAYTVSPQVVTSFPSYISHAINSEVITFTIEPDSTMSPGDHLMTQIDAVC